MRPKHELIADFHDDWGWLHEVQKFYNLDDEALGDLIGVFFAERNRSGLPVAVPDWTNVLQGDLLEERKKSIIAARGWAPDMSLNGTMHLEYLGRDEYKKDLHSIFLSALDAYTGTNKEPRILDFGSGTSSFCQVALYAGYHVTCVLADVDKEVLEYTDAYYARRWPGTTTVHAIEIEGRPISKRARVRVKYKALQGPYDVIILADVLEHTLDPLAILIHLFSQLTPRGLLFVNYPAEIEGDWHTPEAYFLRKWCYRFLRITCEQIDHCTWRRRPLPAAPVTAAFLVANHFLIRRARTFATRYFKEHGLEIVEEIERKARRVVRVDDLLASV
jgi:2-polyprenyl-3-methyl-5-hydroxy-6-metoxy-1,4-benzoquinol methylase